MDQPEVQGLADCEVTALAYDSQEVERGTVFVAVRGFKQDGHRYVHQAVKQGAVAVVVEKGWSGDSLPGACSVIRVVDSRRALSALAHQFYGRPSHRLGMIGVTGTNGKTTTTHVIQRILEASGKKVGLLGTVGYRLGTEILPAPHTTPESLDLQRLLARMVQAGLEYAVMEVSSHALALDRVRDCAFDVAVFTNLSQDHLDFHGTMEDYFRAKLRLFAGLGVENPKSFPRLAVVNGDDPRGAEVVSSTPTPCWTYKLEGKADLMAEGVQVDFGGIRFLARTPRGEFRVQSSLTGRYNVSNLLAAIGVALGLGTPIPLIQKGIEETRYVPGRFEKIQEGQEFLVIVDYAHTEDALRQVLVAARGLAPGRGGRVLAVFGCGGDRDRGKRPMMGRVAAEHSDFVFLTSDNPRTEDPMDIIKEIETGIRQGPEGLYRFRGYMVIPDRAEAIHKAVKMARRGDVVVIAGKGHEDYQILGDRRIHFDDREVAREAIRGLKAGGR